MDLDLWPLCIELAIGRLKHSYHYTGHTIDIEGIATDLAGLPEGIQKGGHDCEGTRVLSWARAITMQMGDSRGFGERHGRLLVGKSKMFRESEETDLGE